jgi:hypothetical protein
MKHSCILFTQEDENGQPIHHSSFILHRSYFIRHLSFVTFVLTTAMIFSGCEELVVNTYEDYTSVYFYRGQNNVYGNAQNDSLSYSFFYTESSALSDTVWIDVRLTGRPAPVDRPLPLSQVDPEPERADDKTLPGIHYRAFDDPGLHPFLIMPAGKVVAKIPIVLLRNESLQKKEYRLWMELGSNEYFEPGVKEQQRFLLKISDLTVQPGNWDTVWKSIFGTWSVVKMKFIIDYVGVDNFDIPILYADMRIYLNQKAKNKLIEYEAANGPLYDETGSRVSFPLVY